MSAVASTEELYGRAMEEFARRVHAIEPGLWNEPTPCADWDVHALVRHLVVEMLWAPELLRGATLAEIGDRFDGDVLGDDPVSAWDSASAAARDAVSAPGALERTVHLSYGDRPAEHYVRELTTDLAVHAWDLARGIGADDRLDPDLVAATYELALPHVADLAPSGWFAPALEPPADADQQSRMLALFGRRG